MGTRTTFLMSIFAKSANPVLSTGNGQKQCRLDVAMKFANSTIQVQATANMQTNVGIPKSQNLAKKRQTRRHQPRQPLLLKKLAAIRRRSTGKQPLSVASRTSTRKSSVAKKASK